MGFTFSHCILLTKPPSFEQCAPPSFVPCPCENDAAWGLQATEGGKCWYEVRSTPERALGRSRFQLAPLESIRRQSSREACIRGPTTACWGCLLTTRLYENRGRVTAENTDQINIVRTFGGNAETGFQVMAGGESRLAMALPTWTWVHFPPRAVFTPLVELGRQSRFSSAAGAKTLTEHRDRGRSTRG